MATEATKQLSDMSLTGETFEHGAVANNAEWRKELEQLSGKLPASYELSKTLVFKPSKYPIPKNMCCKL
jgi:hypothetical protein